MYLCSAACGYSHWKFKCIGFVLNGIDYCAVLVKGKRWTTYSPHSPLSVSEFSGQQQAFLRIWWRVSVASTFKFTLCANAFKLWSYKRRVRPIDAWGLYIRFLASSRWKWGFYTTPKCLHPFFYSHISHLFTYPAKTVNPTERKTYIN